MSPKLHEESTQPCYLFQIREKITLGSKLLLLIPVFFY